MLPVLSHSCLKEKSYSQRLACSLAGLDLRVYRRKLSPSGGAELRVRTKELATECRRFRVSNVIDDYSTECLAAVVDTLISGTRAAREGDWIAEICGDPAQAAGDYGTELTSNAMVKWQEDRKVGWHYAAPGEPIKSGFVESFNGRMRA